MAAFQGAPRQTGDSAAMPSSHDVFDFSQLLAASAVRAHLPLYQRMALSLRAAMRSGALPVGTGVPPERELAAMLGVSRVTVRRAIEELVNEGLLKAKQGSGTSVAGRVEQPLSALGSFSEDMVRRGLVPGSRWISRQLSHPSSDEVLALGLAPTEQVIRLARVRTADGAPIAVERATIRAALLAGELNFGDSLYEALRQHGITPQRAFQRLRAEAVNTQDARLLGLQGGDPVLATERRSFTGEGRPVEFTRSVYRGDRYDYVLELNASPLGNAPLAAAVAGAAS